MLTQQRTSGRQIFPSPADGALVEETPPVFSFLKERGEAVYTVIVQNEAGEPVYSGETTRNYLVPGQILPLTLDEMRQMIDEDQSFAVVFTKEDCPYEPVN